MQLEDRFRKEWQPGEELSRPGVLLVCGVVDTFDVRHKLGLNCEILIRAYAGLYVRLSHGTSLEHQTIS
jgi:hypothetical protein